MARSSQKPKSTDVLPTEVPPRGKIYVDMRCWNTTTKRMQFIKGSSIILENFSPAEAKAVIGRALAEYAAAHQKPQEQPNDEKENAASGGSESGSADAGARPERAAERADAGRQPDATPDPDPVD